MNKICNQNMIGIIYKNVGLLGRVVVLFTIQFSDVSSTSQSYLQDEAKSEY